MISQRRSAAQALFFLQRRRFLPIRRRNYHEVSYLERGDPLQVLGYHHTDDEPKHSTLDYVKVKMLAAPWNPADKNTVQGKYPSPSTNPLPQPQSARGEEWKVSGSEGWGQIEVSEDAEIPSGTFVTLGASGMGTLRSSLWLPKSAVTKVERGMDLQEKVGAAGGSLIFQLGGTALRLLQDFESLSENHAVLLNAGNSGVGHFVSQLAMDRSIQVISLVRRGSKSPEDYNKLVAKLTQQSTNTTQVVAEEDLIENKDALKELQAKVGKPIRLALNAVGGTSTDLLLKLLSPGGTMVTYGGLSMKPVTVATPQLIFKDVKVQGYWHSRWVARSFPQARKRMVDDLVGAVLDRNVTCPPFHVFPLSQVKEALSFEADQSSEAIRKKVVFDCQAKGAV